MEEFPMAKKEIDWSNIGFGYIKTDYRYVSNFKDGSWDEGTLTTDDMITLNECACVFQYAQTCFEGLKAYTTEDGHIVTFRPDLNAERMMNSAARLEMPQFPKERFIDAITKLVAANADFVPPYGSGATLYIRPYMFGTNPVIGVKPATEYQFRAFCTPVGPYFKGGAKPITIRVTDFDRAAPHGTGHVKAGLNYAMSLLEEQIHELRASLAAIAKEMERLEQENTERETKIGTDSTALEQAKADRDTASAALSEVQLEAANLKQQDSFLDQNIHRLEDEKERLLSERMSLHDGHTDSKHEVEKRLAQIEELKEKIKDAGKDAETYRQEMAAAQEEKAAKNEAQKGFFEKREALSARISDLDKELIRLQNQNDKLAERQDSQVDYMWNEYGLTFSTAELLRDETLTNAADMKRQIAERKNAIRGLGNVNVNAIEDYKEISERYEFMKTQHDDLVAAQDALYKIIEELDIGMRKQFTEKFALIRAEFDKVFRELFGGGHGSLELIEDEDILEAGIQIISQPPGKKLQNMMQMSGGEKALTAIALLFAIQNLKPSPFCLLDEIEAALDDSNVDRYAKYLHKLTKHTQFIVITHRRGTMLAADRLYGITMQEKGVSTLVSVNLIENDLK